MRQSLKKVTVAVSDRLLRGFIRYSPVQTGKHRAWKLYQERFGWRPRPVIATTPFGFKLQVQLPDNLPKVVWLTGRWEPVITQFFRTTLAPGDTFIDVGANIGYYSLLASRIVGARGHVYSIEASPTLFSVLRGNIELNHAANVETINVIAAADEGEKEFWLASRDFSGHSTAVETLARKEGMSSEGRVRCAPLPSIVPRGRLLSARLIKIDVEGSERAVLEPILDHLPEFSRQTVWVVELSPENCPGGQTDVEHIFNSFCKHGYVASLIRNEYVPATYLLRPRTVEMTRITAAPSFPVDVVFFHE